MADRIVWVVPGLLSSELVVTDSPYLPSGRTAWLERSDLWKIDLRALKFSPENVLRATRVIEGMDGLAAHLRATAPPHTTIAEWPYDWRADVLSNGDDLALAIQEEGGPVGRHYIVAHSEGGLVARAAYQALGSDRDRIRRIITLGTPHQGSYYPWQVWRGEDSSLALLQLTQVVQGIDGFSPLPVDPRGPAERVMEVWSSWPSVYSLLPDPFSSEQIASPYLDTALTSVPWTWPSVPPRDELAQAARDGWQQLNADGGIPPSDVLRCVAGTGVSTPAQVLPPLESRRYTLLYWQQPYGLYWKFLDDRDLGCPLLTLSDAGDGRVHTRSSLPGGYDGIFVRGRHDTLPGHPHVRQRIWTLLEIDDPVEAIQPPPTIPGPILPWVPPRPGSRRCERARI